jgi:hypothetical protein
MKIFASVLLLFFVLFLVAPTIVAYLEKDKDAVDFCEDCNTPSSSIEEVKHVIKYYTFNSFLEISFFDFEKDSEIIVFENLSKHDLICATIFIPPPNFV